MPEIDNPTEILDLVNERDERIGSIARSEVLSLGASGRGFVRAVLVFLINKNGELWLPVRSQTKKVAPGGLDASAGEHVEAGETYEAAAKRGLLEETNIQAEPSELEYVGTVPPFKDMPYFHKIYLYPTDKTPDYNPSDYSSYEWLTPEQIIARLTAGARAKEVLGPAIELVIKKGETA